MATAKANLKEFLTCTVCYEEFSGRDPRFLPCGHGFCISCIEHIHQIASNDRTSELRDDEFKCPTCQTVSSIPRRSIDNYPKFFHASQMNDVYQEMLKPSLDKWTVCWKDQHKVEGYCFTCNKSFCHQCFLPHIKTRRYSDHAHVHVTKDNIQCLVCKEHDQFVEAYCADCGKSVCGQCLITTHADHDVQDFTISKVLEQDITTEIKERRSASKENIARIDQIQQDFNSNIQNVKDGISKHAQILIDNVIEQSKSLHAKLDKHQRDTNRELEKMKENIRESENLINKAEQQIQERTQPIPQLPEVRPKHVDRIITDIRRQLPKRTTVKENIKKYKFNPETSQVLLGSLSELNQSQHKVPSLSSAQISQPGDQNKRSSAKESVLVQSQGIRHTLPGTVTPTSADLIKKINIGGVVQDVAWTDIGDLMVVCDNCITLYDRSGKTMPTPFYLSDLEGRIHAVAVHPTQSTVAVANKCKKEGSNNDFFLVLFGIRQSAVRVFSIPVKCSCLTFSSDGDLLVCTYGSQHIKYKADGTKLWQTKTKHQAFYTTMLPDSKCLVSGFKQMSVYDKEGQLISSFPSDPQHLYYPCGVCADSRGHVYVADCKKKAVLMFTSDGRYIRELMKCQSEPINLALYQDRYLCVTQSGEGVCCFQICLYTLESQ